MQRKLPGTSGPSQETQLQAALRRCRKGFVGVTMFSAMANILMLVAPVYMLQMYDRVLTSASYETLIVLTVVAIFLLACFGMLDWVRQRMMARIALFLNYEVLDDVLAGVFRGSLQRFRQSANQPVRDLDTVRQFISSPPALAFFDAPWAPVFIAAIFLIHPWLGFLAIFAALFILFLALLTEWTSRGPFRNASEHTAESHRFVENSLRHADVLEAMGMFEGFRRRWRDKHDRGIAFHTRGGGRVSMLLASSKASRQIVQVGILGLGAWLVLKQQISPGMMIAASIILGRALAPIEQGISAWRGFISARQSWLRLNNLLTSAPPTHGGGATSLPRPTGLLEVEGVSAAPPGTTVLTLKRVSFTLEPGSGTGLIGPSGSGKSTLARLMVGVWIPQGGVVRLDGAAIADWPTERTLPPRGLPAPGGGTVRGHRGREHRPVVRTGQRCGPRRRATGELPRHDHAPAGELQHVHRGRRRQPVGRAAPARGPGAGLVRRPGADNPGRTGREPGHGRRDGAQEYLARSVQARRHDPDCDPQLPPAADGQECTGTEGRRPAGERPTRGSPEALHAPRADHR